MAVIPRVMVRTDGQGASLLAEWNALADADTAAPLLVGEYEHLTVQVLEILAGAPTVIFQGSLSRPDETPVWFTLEDVHGDGVSFVNAVGGARLAAPVAMVRPDVTAAGTVRVRILAVRGGRG